jgi:ribosomal protein S4E
MKNERERVRVLGGPWAGKHGVIEAIEVTKYLVKLVLVRLEDGHGYWTTESNVDERG